MPRPVNENVKLALVALVVLAGFILLVGWLCARIVGTP
jgi:hypothetical protein